MSKDAKGKEKPKRASRFIPKAAYSPPKQKTEWVVCLGPKAGTHKFRSVSRSGNRICDYCAKRIAELTRAHGKTHTISDPNLMPEH